MATFNKFRAFVEAVGQKKLNLNADQLNVLLTDTSPVNTNSVYADISGTELANGNGYLTGGKQVTNNTYTQTAGVGKLVGDDVTWTATGSMGPFRYVVLYDFTATNKDLIGWWDRGTSVTLVAPDTFTSDFDQTAGILTIT